uniref:WD40 repeat n=1 Tax=Candidatus Kentrum sp. FM TaxID=2126340 RepID=A0A450TKT8_9GAMM|nr:MAG: WD40 repeat [Candidatus Kentron sp. FM]
MDQDLFVDWILPTVLIMKTPFSVLFLLCLLLAGPFTPAQAQDSPRLVIDTGGHQAKIQDVIFTPDGQQLISVSNDKTIRVWEVASGEPVRTLRGEMGQGHEGKLYAGALSPDGRWLAVGGYTKNDEIRLIDLQGPADAPVRLLQGHTDVVLSLAFSPDGGRLLSGSGDNTARLWDVESGKPLAVLRGHTDHIYAVAFSLDGGRLVTGSDDQTLRLWAAPGKGRTRARLLAKLTGHSDKVKAAAFTPDGRYLLSGGWDKTLRLWDGREGGFIQELARQNRGVASLSIAPDGKSVLTGSGEAGSGGLINHVFAIPSGKRLLRFDEHENLVIATAISPDGRLAATGGGNDKEIILWELATGKVRHTLAGKGGPIWSVGFARDGTGVAWGKVGRTDPNPFVFTKLQHRFQLRRAGLSIDRKGAAFDPGWGGPVEGEGPMNRHYLRAIETVGATRIRTANGQMHPTLEIIENGQLRHRITLGPTDGYRHNALTLTPDGQTVISGGGWGFIASYDVATGRKRHEFTGHTGDVWALAPSPDGRWLVSGSWDQTVRLWEIETGKALLTIFPANDNEWVAWTPEGYYTASLNGGRLIGWHMNQGEERLARYYPAERFAKQFHQPRVVAHYLATGGDLKRAIALANIALADAEGTRRGTGGRPDERLKETAAADLPALFPPMVFIKEPNRSQFSTGRARLVLITEVRSVNDEPVSRLWITVNGRRPGQGMVRRFAEGTRRGEFQTTLALDPGENRIAVYAKNRHSQSEPEMLFVTRNDPKPEPEPRKPNLYLLAIGVSEYADSAYDLRYADDDAEAVTRAFEAQAGSLYHRVQTRLLTNGEADGRSVLDGLDWLIRKSNADYAPGDVSMIFIAGHGTKDKRGHYHFLPHDVDLEDLRTGVKWFEFQDALAHLPGTRWLLADTCYSGGITGGRGVRVSLESSDITDALRDLRRVEGGVVVMAAAGSRQESLEKDAWGHGAFTKALLEGLAGQANYKKDKRIDIKELDLYLANQVKELTDGRQSAMTQTPQMVPNFPVALVEAP